jgi:hypothetical protein
MLGSDCATPIPVNPEPTAAPNQNVVKIDRLMRIFSFR